MKPGRDREREVENGHFPSNLDLSHPHICSQYIVPKPGPDIVKIFIKTKAEGTELLGRQIKVQIGGWGRARSGVEGALQMPQEGPLWSGLGGRPFTPPLPPTLSVKVPHSPLPSHIHPGGSWGPAVTPWEETTPSIHPWLSVSQSVSLPHFPNK